ncbi:MAG: T9SS type A sorting domain-containing protein [Bacteroidales bacterium]|nr:T9SS type A sorting domain-containing protein [Bacteroidales bacterium]
MQLKFYLLLIAIVLLFSEAKSQPGIDGQKATLITRAEYMIEVPSLASQIATGQFIPAGEHAAVVNPKRRDANKAVPGKGFPKHGDPLWKQQLKTPMSKGPEPVLTFTSASSNVTPTDPTGAVGPNHYVNAWNSAFRVWDKQGNPLTAVASLSTIFPGETAGDPIVMYDPFADRFLITEFTFLNGFLVAVSQGPDPVNDGWYTYFFPTNSFPDYPKYSIWSDGYYITANKNSNTAGTSQVVFALERDKMLNGDPTAMMQGFPLPTITTSGFYSPLGFNVNGTQLPPPGNAPIVYLQDDVWSGVSTDHLKIWNVNVDWNTPSNSYITNPQIINTQPFDGLFDGGSFSNLPQPSGQDIDALQATVMYMAQYRRFTTHNAVVFNFVVDLDGSDDLAGIRWYELRQTTDGEPWEIYQEGTFAQPDGHSAFAGNMCMDASGNIALAYTVVSQTKYPSLGYTGRYSTDPLNVMTIAEELYAGGTQSDPSFRYGDYSQMTIDPNDDLTFWSTGEYFTGGSRKNQVVVFKLAPELTHDVGIVSVDAPVNGILSGAEPVTVSIRNFGVGIQTSVPVSFKIDDGPVVTEVFTGSLASNTVAQYTFTTTGDFSQAGIIYKIHASTELGSDENNDNDTISAFVTCLYADDIGVTGISSPVSGSYLSDEEIVTVTIMNFGADTQANFDVAFILNGGGPVTEQVAGPLQAETAMTYTFSATADLSVIGDHQFTVTTSLPGDAVPGNDAITTIITNSLCQPELMCQQGVSISVLELGDIYNDSGCDPDGYGDYSGMTTPLLQGSSNDLTITTGYGDVFVKGWIDFNDNFLYEQDEVVVNDFVIAEGQNAGTYTETMPLAIGGQAIPGEHLMRVKLNYNESVPNDPCAVTTFGETEDYTVDIVNATSLGEQNQENSELILVNEGNNHFFMTYNTRKTTETLTISIRNMQGNKVIQNRVPKVNDSYKFDFDMSYASPGVYLLRLGSDRFGKVKRFVVH